MTLCEKILVELGKPGRTVVWVKIPSHVGIEGDTHADLLANLSRLAILLHPLWRHGP